MRTKTFRRARAALQVKHDRARLLSDLGAAAAAASDLSELRSLARQAIHEGLSKNDVLLFDTSDPDRMGIRVGHGQHGFILTPQRILSDDDMRFLRTLASLIDGAHTRMVAELAVLEAKRFEGVGRLATSVAHDFNNLLMPICASYELIEGFNRTMNNCVKSFHPVRLRASKRISRGETARPRQVY